MLTFLFILHALLGSNRPQRQVVLEPLVLVLVVDEVSEQAPVTRGLLRAFDDEIVALVAEVRHRLHIDDLILDVHELLEAKCIARDGNLRIANLKHAFE